MRKSLLSFLIILFLLFSLLTPQLFADSNIKIVTVTGINIHSHVKSYQKIKVKKALYTSDGKLYRLVVDSEQGVLYVAVPLAISNGQDIYYFSPFDALKYKKVKDSYINMFEYDLSFSPMPNLGSGFTLYMTSNIGIEIKIHVGGYIANSKNVQIALVNRTLDYMYENDRKLYLRPLRDFSHNATTATVNLKIHLPEIACLQTAYLAYSQLPDNVLWWKENITCNHKSREYKLTIPVQSKFFTGGMYPSLTLHLVTGEDKNANWSYLSVRGNNVDKVSVSVKPYYGVLPEYVQHISHLSWKILEGKQVEVEIEPIEKWKILDVKLNGNEVNTMWFSKKITFNVLTHGNYVLTLDVRPNYAIAVFDVGKYEFSIDGESKKIDSPLFIDPVKGRLMVPLRALLEGLGYEVGYDSLHREVTVKNLPGLSVKQDISISLRGLRKERIKVLGKYAYVYRSNGVIWNKDRKRYENWSKWGTPLVYKNKLYVPVRWVELLTTDSYGITPHARITWVPEDRRVIVEMER